MMIALGAGIAALAGIGAGVGTVSYTHLDVYKRQCRSCVPHARSFLWRSHPGGNRKMR